MASVSDPGKKSFDDFFAEWFRKQEVQLQELQDALQSNMGEGEIQQLISRVHMHYRDYYDAKCNVAKQNVLKITHPNWKTPLENAFSWIGGWRPTMVFQLVFAEAGHQLENELAELLDGVDTPSMASLTSKQLTQINDLQLRTQELEKDLSHRKAVLQQGMADEPLLTLARLEKCGESSEGGGGAAGSEGATAEGAVDEKLKALEALLLDADSLRFETLSEMLVLLSPFQAAQYLLAAAQLQKALRNFGKRLEAEDA